MNPGSPEAARASASDTQMRVPAVNLPALPMRTTPSPLYSTRYRCSSLMMGF